MSRKTEASGHTLLVDIGNTRVKWAVLRQGGRIGRMHAAGHAGWSRRDFVRTVLGSGGTVGRVLVVSVAGSRIDGLFASAVRAVTGSSPEFLVSARQVAGVITTYSEPWRLGADRLAGMIGARRLSRGRPVCVVGVGTALTLDLVDERGRHLGGAIVPSPELMKHSLLTKTSGIRRRARGGSGSNALFGRSTRAGIEQGARFAAAAFVDRGVHEARRRLGRAPLVVITGGGAAALEPLIRSRHIRVPDLVLQGLAGVA